MTIDFMNYYEFCSCQTQKVTYERAVKMDDIYISGHNAWRRMYLDTMRRLVQTDE
jgi:hypothetical protein